MRVQCMSNTDLDTRYNYKKNSSIYLGHIKVNPTDLMFHCCTDRERWHFSRTISSSNLWRTSDERVTSAWPSDRVSGRTVVLMSFTSVMYHDFSVCKEKSKAPYYRIRLSSLQLNPVLSARNIFELWLFGINKGWRIFYREDNTCSFFDESQVVLLMS